MLSACGISWPERYFHNGINCAMVWGLLNCWVLVKDTTRELNEFASYLYIAVMKHYDQKTSWRERSLFILHFHITLHRRKKSGQGAGCKSWCRSSGGARLTRVPYSIWTFSSLFLIKCFWMRGLADRRRSGQLYRILIWRKKSCGKLLSKHAMQRSTQWGILCMAWVWTVTRIRIRQSRILFYFIGKSVL